MEAGDDDDGNAILVFSGECFFCEDEVSLINVVSADGTDIHLCRDCISRAFSVATPDNEAN